MADFHYSDTQRLRAGDAWSLAFTNLGDLSAATELVFAIKAHRTDPDADSMLLVSLGTGLERVMGSTGTASEASITVDDEANGNLTVAVDAAVTVELKRTSEAVYALKSIPTGGGGTTLKHGRAVILESLIDQVTP